MATLDDLVLRVQKAIGDEDFTFDYITEVLNDGVQEITGGMQSSLGDFITPPLPKLFTIGTVTTDLVEAFVAMPATFQRSLVFVADAQGNEIDIENSWNEFIAPNPLLDQTGRSYTTIEKGNMFYYQGIPTVAEEFTLHFYRAPVDMVADTDVPDGLPDHLHIPLLVNYACHNLFELVEDEIEGEKGNTKNYENRFLRALRTLELSIPCETNSFMSSF
jgi:hypothetical protein